MIRDTTTHYLDIPPKHHRNLDQPPRWEVIHGTGYY
jgi:hypothetical protein